MPHTLYKFHVHSVNTDTQGGHAVFLSKTLNSLAVPLSTQEYKWVPANCQGKLTKCWELTWCNNNNNNNNNNNGSLNACCVASMRRTSIPSSGSSNTSSQLHASKTGISSGSIFTFTLTHALRGTLWLENTVLAIILLYYGKH